MVIGEMSLAAQVLENALDPLPQAFEHEYLR